MRILTRCLLLTFLVCALSALSAAQSATGNLSVSFTVEPSSTVIVTPDGTLKVQVVNPPAANDAYAIYLPPEPLIQDRECIEQKLNAPHIRTKVVRDPKQAR